MCARQLKSWCLAALRSWFSALAISAPGRCGTRRTIVTTCRTQVSIMALCTLHSTVQKNLSPSCAFAGTRNRGGDGVTQQTLPTAVFSLSGIALQREAQGPSLSLVSGFGVGRHHWSAHKDSAGRMAAWPHERRALGHALFGLHLRLHRGSRKRVIATPTPSRLFLEGTGAGLHPAFFYSATVSAGLFTSGYRSGFSWSRFLHGDSGANPTARDTALHFSRRTG